MQESVLWQRALAGHLRRQGTSNICSQPDCSSFLVKKGQPGTGGADFNDCRNRCLHSDVVIIDDRSDAMMLFVTITDV